MCYTSVQLCTLKIKKCLFCDKIFGKTVLQKHFEIVHNVTNDTVKSIMENIDTNADMFNDNMEICDATSITVDTNDTPIEPTDTYMDTENTLIDTNFSSNPLNITSDPRVLQPSRFVMDMENMSSVTMDTDTNMTPISDAATGVFSSGTYQTLYLRAKI